MKVLIDYYDALTTQRVSFKNLDVNEETWNKLFFFTADYIEEKYLVKSIESIDFPWYLFLGLKGNFNAFFKVNGIKVEFSEAARNRLKQANSVSYSVAIALPKKTENEIQEKLKKEKFERKLTVNQLKNLIKISSLPSAATFSVPGAGKTTEALAYFFINATKDSRLLVVAPKNAFGAWDEQLSDCLPKLEDHFYRLRGGEHNIELTLKSKPRFMIITYEQFPSVKSLIAETLADGNVFMFLDECHRIKSGRQGVRADAILDVSYLPNKKLIMSGTPMPQSVKDLLPQFAFLYPSMVVDEESVVALIREIYVRTTKGQLGIPEVTRNIVRVAMPPLQRELYNSLKYETKRQLIKIIKDGSKQQLRKIGKCVMKVMEFVSNPALLANDLGFVFDRRVAEVLRTTDGPKIEYVCQRTRDLVAQGKKVLIWSSFGRNVELISERLCDLGAVYIHGGVDAGSEEDFDTREGKIKKFHDDKNCMVMVANPAACSEGISLHKVCQTAIYLDRTFNATHYLQSEDRIHRLGLAPDAKPYVEIVECEESIDQVINARLNHKISCMAEALEDSSLQVMPNSIEILEDDINEEDSLTSEDAEAIKAYFFGESDD